ncbi:MAG TPA: alpha/beta fold hydrolase [Anaerolineae bacterium]|nr:alpha/beta fold hydrolase [Anaerolineae bacterium]
MKSSLSRRRRVLRWITLFVAVAIIVLYIVLPIGVGVSVVLPYQETVGAPPAGFEAIALTTDDQVTLAAWYKPPINGAAIILIHGAGGSREGMRPYAEMLARHGYGVLALDLRGHGTSAGSINRFGWQGTRDVGAAVAYLKERSEVKAIGGLGSSLGGEVLLGAASKYPTLKAVVADGATARCLNELLTLPSERPLYRNFTARVMYAAVQILSGETPPEPFVDSMIAAPLTSYLLIAGGDNEKEVAFNELFAASVGEQATLWVAPGARHTGAFGLYPDEYERRVIAFFDAALRDESEPGQVR